MRDRDDADGAQRSIVYRTYRRWYPIYALVGLAFFLVFSLVAIAQMGMAGLGFSLIWFPAATLIAWLNLYLIVFELRLEDGQFKWRAPLRSGEVLVKEVRSVRNVVPTWPWPIVRFQIADQLSVFIIGKRSLRAFVDRLAAANPGFQIDARSYATWRYELWVI